MISVGENKAIICKGDFHPAALYKGDKKIAGYIVEEFSGEGSVTLENCYNDKLRDAQIIGNSIQDGTPTPGTPVEVQSVGELVTEGEYAGKYKVPVTVRGKNLFKYISGGLSNGSIIEQLPNGAIVKGNLNPDTTTTYVYSKGWFRPGRQQNTATCPFLLVGDTVTVSADITLLEIIADDGHGIGFSLTARDESAGYERPIIGLNIGETIRLSWTIENTKSDAIYYPVFKLNSNVVKIENIQIEYDTATPFEPYTEPQTVNIYLDEPLRKVGDYADYIDSDKDVVVRLNTEAEILKVGNDYNGTLSLCAYGNYNGEHQRLRAGIKRSAPILCSHINTLGWSNDTRLFISFRYSDFGVTNRTELQAKFDEIAESGTPLKVVYTHETPIEEAVELPELPTFKGTTIYEIGTQITATISGKYKKVEE